MQSSRRNQNHLSCGKMSLISEHPCQWLYTCQWTSLSMVIHRSVNIPVNGHTHVSEHPCQWLYTCQWTSLSMAMHMSANIPVNGYTHVNVGNQHSYICGILNFKINEIDLIIIVTNLRIIQCKNNIKIAESEIKGLSKLLFLFFLTSPVWSLLNRNERKCRREQWQS